MVDLLNVSDALHVRRVASRAKDTSDLRLRIDIMRSDKGPSRVIDDCCKLDW